MFKLSTMPALQLGYGSSDPSNRTEAWLSLGFDVQRPLDLSLLHGADLVLPTLDVLADDSCAAPMSCILLCDSQAGQV